jgi:tripartite-type tricarboxylate transporter receptor subunit TctC
VEYLSKAIRKAMQSPALIAKVNQGGSEVIASDQKSFIQKVGQEIAEWKQVVKSSGVRAE